MTINTMENYRLTPLDSDLFKQIELTPEQWVHARCCEGWVSTCLTGSREIGTLGEIWHEGRSHSGAVLVRSYRGWTDLLSEEPKWEGTYGDWVKAGHPRLFAVVPTEEALQGLLREVKASYPDPEFRVELSKDRGPLHERVVIAQGDRCAITFSVGGHPEGWTSWF